MNHKYINFDLTMDTKTVINIKVDSLSTTLTISYKTGTELDKEYRYSGTRVCFHRLVKTIISLYERGEFELAGFYNQPFKDLLNSWFSNTELQDALSEYGVNDPIDLVDALLKEGAFKALKCAFKMR